MSCAEQLITHFGGRKEAAVAMGRSTETIRLWLRDGIPLEVAVDVEVATKGKVRAEDVLHEVRKARGGVQGTTSGISRHAAAKSRRATVQA